MRDHLKDVDYFITFIDEELSRIDRFALQLERGEIAPERIIPVKAVMHDLRLGILTAKYSKGDDLSLLEQEYLSILDEWEEVWVPDYYNKNLKMISLAVLFKVDSIFGAKIRQMLEKSGIKDWLLSFLLNSLDNNSDVLSKDMLFPKSFHTLQELVFGEGGIELLDRYLSKEWYNKDCGCYRAHKSRCNVYYGYWSFDAGAIAKILGLHDDSLKAKRYYPYDLVHY